MNGPSNVFIYSPELVRVEFSPTHPFKPVRAKLMMELLNRYGLMPEGDARTLIPDPLNEELLNLFHDPKYVGLLKRADEGEFDAGMLYAGLGRGDNPIFRGMYAFSLLVCGATHEGALLVADNQARMAFNPVGGLHHAGKDEASGFCYVNDIAIAINDLLRRGLRVASIDIDVHHGNGVQDAFYDTDRVLTISIHESGETIYPGTGFENEIGIGKGEGFNVNIPLRNGSDDEIHSYAFEAVVPSILEKFKPDIVFAQVGADTHKDDPLGHLNLTSRGYKRAIETINRFSPRVVAMGGGGYNVHKAAALWTLAWSVLSGLKPIDQYAGLIGGMMFGPELNAGSLDDPPFSCDEPEKEVCFAYAERVVSYIRNVVFPIHGI